MKKHSILFLALMIFLSSAAGVFSIPGSVSAPAADSGGNYSSLASPFSNFEEAVKAGVPINPEFRSALNHTNNVSDRLALHGVNQIVSKKVFVPLERTLSAQALTASGKPNSPPGRHRADIELVLFFLLVYFVLLAQSNLPWSLFSQFKYRGPFRFTGWVFLLPDAGIAA